MKLKEEDWDEFNEWVLDTFVESFHEEFIIDVGGAVHHLDTMIDDLAKDEEVVKDFYEWRDGK